MDATLIFLALVLMWVLAGVRSGFFLMSRFYRLGRGRSYHGGGVISILALSSLLGGSLSMLLIGEFRVTIFTFIVSLLAANAVALLAAFLIVSRGGWPKRENGH